MCVVKLIVDHFITPQYRCIPDFPSIEAPPREEHGESDKRGGRHATSLRDFMLKTPDEPAHKSPSVVPGEGNPSTPSRHTDPFDHWTPFSKVKPHTFKI